MNIYMFGSGFGVTWSDDIYIYIYIYSYESHIVYSTRVMLSLFSFPPK